MDLRASLLRDGFVPFPPTVASAARFVLPCRAEGEGFAAAGRGRDSGMNSTSRCPTRRPGPNVRRCLRRRKCPSAGAADPNGAGSRCFTRSPISSFPRSTSPSTSPAASAPISRERLSTTGSGSERTRRCISPCSSGASGRSARPMASCPPMPACGSGSGHGRRSARRLAVVPMVLERAGSTSIGRGGPFEAAGDTRSAAILGRIYRDEIRHVAAGSKWFRWGCESQRIEPVAAWKRLVGAHFRGALKPPFNDSARDEAGLSRDYYMALAVAGDV